MLSVNVMSNIVMCIVVYRPTSEHSGSSFLRHEGREVMRSVFERKRHGNLSDTARRVLEVVQRERERRTRGG